MERKTHLRDYFPNYLTTEALFTQMSVLGAPWSSEVGQDMDDAYFTMYSGIKNPSEFVKIHLNPDSDIANALTIARIIYGIYGQNWTKLWEAFQSKYVPLDNYNIQETTDRNANNDRTINKISTSDNTTDETLTVTYGQQVDSTGTAQSYTYGFNSTEKVPTAEQDEVGREVNSGSDDTATKATQNSKTVDDTTDMDEETEHIQRTRQGNVGQNTYQELLRQEFDLWKWNFFIQVFNDVDKFLVLSTYSCI